MKNRKVQALDLAALPIEAGQQVTIVRDGQSVLCAVDPCPGCSDSSGKVDSVEKVCPVCHGNRIVLTPIDGPLVRPGGFYLEEKPVLSIEDVSINYEFLLRNAGHLGGH